MIIFAFHTEPTIHFMMKKLIVTLLAVCLTAPAAVRADEGMWLLPFIGQKNIEAMKKAGFTLSAEDISSINQHALKDAIVLFGGGCTGEVVSPAGLLFTNHHCGYGSIQALSSVNRDLLKNGFWAASNAEELSAPGLNVVFVKQIKDVTPEVLKGVTDKNRTERIAKNIAALVKPYDNPELCRSARVVPMFGGNQYLLFEEEKFGDVRLVGAPPSSIGKFGGETDNWMWPRHTGDFSVFRIYADKNNRPTKEYSAANKPYAAPRHLKVSTAGVESGDYAMILGFPGRTNRYMTSWEIDQVLSQDNPIRIFVRGEKQKLMWEDMLASDTVRIKYAGKYAGSSNYWKNSIGMSRGLKRLGIKAKKQAQEAAFTAWVAAEPQRKAAYGTALSMIQKAVAERMPLQRETQLAREALGAVEGLSFAQTVYGIVKGNPADATQQLTQAAQKFFKNYNPETDRKVSKRMLAIYADSSSTETQVPFFAQVRGQEGQWVDFMIDHSLFTHPDRFAAFAAAPSMEAFQADRVGAAAVSISERATQQAKALEASTALFAEGQRLYLAGLLEMTGGKDMYPDANMTMRMTYGNVLPYKAADAVHYDYYTTGDGILEKYVAGDPEFDVPEKLRELIAAGDFGPYATKDGKLPVAFLTSNDITGGNSGSPVLNAKGELIGLAFDGNWEAMSGDIAFEPELQRCIAVDARYVLFIIDKFAGARHLVDELTVVK